MQSLRTDFAIIIKLEKGEEVVSTLREWAEANQMRSGSFYAIGALSRALLGYFDPQARDYIKIPVESQVEVVSMLGNLAVGEDKSLILHIHAVLSSADGHTVGGHLFEGIVNPTLEVTFFPFRETLLRRQDPDTGLKLLSL
jgi:predicted DNA-binding protein with PD1-like motif